MNLELRQILTMKLEMSNDVQINPFFRPHQSFVTPAYFGLRVNFGFKMAWEEG